MNPHLPSLPSHQGSPPHETPPLPLPLLWVVRVWTVKCPLLTSSVSVSTHWAHYPIVHSHLVHDNGLYILHVHVHVSVTCVFELYIECDVHVCAYNPLSLSLPPALFLSLPPSVFLSLPSSLPPSLTHSFFFPPSLPPSLPPTYLPPAPLPPLKSPFKKWVPNGMTPTKNLAPGGASMRRFVSVTPSKRIRYTS